MPHGYCYLSDAKIVSGTRIFHTGLITLSYYAIPLHPRLLHWQEIAILPFNWIFAWMFGGFILACGTTHLTEIFNIWHGRYPDRRHH